MEQLNNMHDILICLAATLGYRAELGGIHVVNGSTL